MDMYPSDIVSRRAILAAIDAQEGAPHTAIQIKVTNRIVELNGCVGDQLDRTKLIALVAKVSGVATVIDQITIVEPVPLPATTKSKPENDMALAALLAH